MVSFLAEYCGSEPSDIWKRKKKSEEQDSNSGM